RTGIDRFHVAFEVGILGGITHIHLGLEDGIRAAAGFPAFAAVESAGRHHEGSVGSIEFLSQRFDQMDQVLLIALGMRACRTVVEQLIAEYPVFRFDPYPGRASGYVVDTLQTVLHFFFTHHNFEDAMTGAVNRGDDADTTGALVGMLAGAKCGALALPRVWLDKVDREIVQAIIMQTHALLEIGRKSHA
ncbi:MAG: hypothetical protein HGA47_16100, partial [Zoogloea sp.]|nr:hypothetical protein [Zoogloea sp.]